MNKQEALVILKDFQKYRKGEGEYSEGGVMPKHTVKEIGEAIDTAILELTK